MREPERDKGRIQDMLEHSGEVMDFVRDKSFEDFLGDRILYYAVVKNIEIIGEAAYMTSREFKDAHPEIKWGPLTKMRHVLVHGYASILPEIVWDTAINDIPALVEKLKKL